MPHESTTWPDNQSGSSKTTLCQKSQSPGWQLVPCSRRRSRWTAWRPARLRAAGNVEDSCFHVLNTCGSRVSVILHRRPTCCRPGSGLAPTRMHYDGGFVLNAPCDHDALILIATPARTSCEITRLPARLTRSTWLVLFPATAHATRAPIRKRML